MLIVWKIKDYEIPKYAIDIHTTSGNKNGSRHFIEEGEKSVNFKEVEK